MPSKIESLTGEKIEVTLEDAVEGNKQTNGFSEKAVMQSSVTVKVSGMNESETTRWCCRGLWNTQESIRMSVTRDVTGGHNMSDCMGRAHIKNSFFSARRCSQDPHHLIQ